MHWSLILQLGKIVKVFFNGPIDSFILITVLRKKVYGTEIIREHLKWHRFEYRR